MLSTSNLPCTFTTAPLLLALPNSVVFPDTVIRLVLSVTILKELLPHVPTNAEVSSLTPSITSTLLSTALITAFGS